MSEVLMLMKHWHPVRLASREREREFILDNIHYFTLKINYGVVLTFSSQLLL